MSKARAKANAAAPSGRFSGKNTASRSMKAKNTAGAAKRGASSAKQVGPASRESLRASAAQISAAVSKAPRGQLIKPSEAGLSETPMPVELLAAAADLLRKRAAGKDPSLLVLDDNEELTSEQAAAVLGVSRPHLNQILESEDVPYRRVGDAKRGHRRIKRDEVLALKAKRDRAAVRMDELMRLSEELAD